MKLCLFDIDGTLVNTGGAGQKAFVQVFAELFDVENIHGKVPFAGRSDRAITLDLLSAYGLESTESAFQSFQKLYLRYLREQLPVCDGHIPVGITELLEKLGARKDVRLGLLTGNMQAGAAAKLAHYGLLKWFPFGGYGDHLALREEIAQQALAEAIQYEQQVLGKRQFTQYEKVLVIGDTVHDVTCARAINGHTVAVATGHTSLETLATENPDLLVEDLGEQTSFFKLLG